MSKGPGPGSSSKRRTQKKPQALGSFCLVLRVRSLSQLGELRYFHSHIPKEEITAVINTANIYTTLTAYQAKHTLDPQYSPQQGCYCDPCVMEEKTIKVEEEGVKSVLQAAVEPGFNSKQPRVT